MPKIQFKRKKSTGIGENKLSAGEPLYNLHDKKFYIGGNASSDETPSKHLTEVGVTSAGKVSIGAATDNDFTIKAGTGISVTGNESNRNITITSVPVINDTKQSAQVVRAITKDNSGNLTTVKGTLSAGTGITIDESGNNFTISSPTVVNSLESGATEIAFSVNGQEYRKTITIEGAGMSVESANKWTTGRKITLGGDAEGNVIIDGSANVTLAVAVKDDSHNHTISATGADGLMDVTATGGVNSVTVAVAPYASQQKKASFDTSTTTPTLTTRLNYNGDLYATNIHATKDGEVKKVILEGDSRLSDARTPKSHTHGNITNGGIVGESNRIVITDKDSKITTSSISTAKLSYLTDVTSNIQEQIDVKASSTHRHKVSSTGTSDGPSDTVECVNITVDNGVLKVAAITAAGNAHTHSVNITDTETGTPVE